MQQVTARCHCGKVETATGATQSQIASRLVAAGWRLVWTAHVFRVWGCSPFCARRLKPAERCEVQQLNLAG